MQIHIYLSELGISLANERGSVFPSKLKANIYTAPTFNSVSLWLYVLCLGIDCYYYHENAETLIHIYKILHTNSLQFQGKRLISKISGIILFPFISYSFFFYVPVIESKKNIRRMLFGWIVYIGNLFVRISIMFPSTRLTLCFCISGNVCFQFNKLQIILVGRRNKINDRKFWSMTLILLKNKRFCICMRKPLFSS